jgi:hypothetical protein
MTHLERIQTGDTKTVGVELAEYAAALMNGTAPIDVQTWLKKEANNGNNAR